LARINPDKMSLRELVALESKLQTAIAEARTRERSELKRKLAALASENGFAVSELFGSRNGGKSIGAAKYANPEDPADTWTGRGRKPNWVLARLKKGAKLEDFAI
jgi:DNA-binding protein H-NS